MARPVLILSVSSAIRYVRAIDMSAESARPAEGGKSCDRLTALPSLADSWEGGEAPLIAGAERGGLTRGE